MPWYSWPVKAKGWQVFAMCSAARLAQQGALIRAGCFDSTALSVLKQCERLVQPWTSWPVKAEGWQVFAMWSAARLAQQGVLLELVALIVLLCQY